MHEEGAHDCMVEDCISASMDKPTPMSWIANEAFLTQESLPKWQFRSFLQCFQILTNVVHVLKIDMDPGRGMSRVVKQSCVVMMNHRCDSTDDAQENASLENPLAGVPISATLPDNQ